MSCAYFMLEDICPTCSHPAKEVHIGSVWYGWEFHFYSPSDFIYENKYFDIMSFEDWKKVLKNPKVTIKDENGEIHKYDDFIKYIESTKWVDEKTGRKRKGFHQYCMENRLDQEIANRTWIDKQGWSFSSQWFR